jgi:hypothetical protein
LPGDAQEPTTLLSGRTEGLPSYRVSVPGVVKADLGRGATEAGPVWPSHASSARVFPAGDERAMSASSVLLQARPVPWEEKERKSAPHACYGGRRFLADALSRRSHGPGPGSLNTEEGG